MNTQNTPAKVSQKCSLPRVSLRRRANIFGNQKNSAPRIANVAATPITKWKWPVTKSSLMEAIARSLRARKSPETPPARKSETNPRTKSIAVLSWILAFQRVPNQLSTRTQAGKPREDANSEKTNGDHGFRPLENMCWPQTKKPQRPTPQRARTAARSAQTGFCENVESRCETIPKHGSMATYTSAWAKNQKSRCQRESRVD